MRFFSGHVINNLINKQVKELNREFSKGKVQMAKKYMIQYSWSYRKYKPK
jgi:hypothetical protein